MNILLSSVGRRAYIVRFLREMLEKEDRIITLNSDMHTTAMCISDIAYRSPMIYSEDYIPFLKEICIKEKVDMVLSLFDIDLPILARHKKEFEDMGVSIIVSDKEVVDICNDKWKMNGFLRQIGLRTPTTFMDFDEEMPDFVKKRFEEGGKFIIKPRFGMGSIGIYTADNMEELNLFVQKVQKEIVNSYLKYESGIDMAHSVLIQEKIEGPEYGLDIVNDLNGNYRYTIAKQKLAMRAGETDIAKIISGENFEKIGEVLAKKLSHIGNLDADIMMYEGEAYIIDMNARFGGGYPFTHYAGVNTLEAILRWYAKEEYILPDWNKAVGKIFAKDIDIMEIGI